MHMNIICDVYPINYRRLFENITNRQNTLVLKGVAATVQFRTDCTSMGGGLPDVIFGDRVDNLIFSKVKRPQPVVQK